MCLSWFYFHLFSTLDVCFSLYKSHNHIYIYKKCWEVKWRLISSWDPVILSYQPLKIPRSFSYLKDNGLKHTLIQLGEDLVTPLLPPCFLCENGNSGVAQLLLAECRVICSSFPCNYKLHTLIFVLQSKSRELDIWRQDLIILSFLCNTNQIFDYAVPVKWQLHLNMSIAYRTFQTIILSTIYVQEKLNSFAVVTFF